MKTEHIIIAILLIVILFFIWNENKEHFLTGNEAVFNISRVYADASGTANFNNIRTAGNAGVTGNLDVSGNARVTGNLDVSGNSRFNKITGVDISGVDISGGNLDVYGRANFDGRAQFNNGADFRGATGSNPGGDWTHFAYPDGKNYIRGDTILDGAVRIKGPVFMNTGIYSDGGAYALVMQNDGNLVITRMSDNRVIWDSK